MSPWPVRAVAACVDFVVGDDWILAAGALVVLVLAGLVSLAISSWWVLLAGVPLVLAISLARATRTRPR